MKKLIKSSKMSSSSKQKITSSRNDYTDTYRVRIGNQEFRVYAKYLDDPDNFQCQISEIHPYDNANYYWIQKDQPASASVIKNGKRVGRIEVREYDDEAADEYNDEGERFNRDIVAYLCEELRGYNKNIEPMIDHT